MATGKIKKIVRNEFGFIAQDGGGEDVYFRLTWVKGADASTIREGMAVQFDVQKDAQGRLQTKQVRLAGAAQISNQPRPNPPSGQTKPTSQAHSHSGEYRFLNPYNFVRYLNKERPKNHVLGNCPPPPHDRYTGLTGTITCELEAVSPLFIADAKDVTPNFKTDGHNAYRFFKIVGEKGEKQPALPAASLRGMVRSVFEAVTNSCFGVFEQDEERGQKSRLEYRDTTISPELIPARVVNLQSKSATLELLDCASMGTPPRHHARPSMVKSGAIKEYDPKVLLPAKDGRPARAFRPVGKIPGGVTDGDRVAALVNIQPIMHRSNRFQWFSVEQIAPATGHATLYAGASQKKVFGYLHLTGPNIENKHDERLFFRWDDVNPTPRTGYKPEDVQIDGIVIDEYNRSLARYWERHRESAEQLAGQSPSATNLPFPSSFVKKDRELRQGDLVYYYEASDGSQHIYPVAIPRREYRFPREALLPKHVCRCKNLQTLCPACRTFGWVHEEADDDRTQQIAYAGRVRFSLGTLKNETTIQYVEADPDGIALAILGTPKPTTTLFYLLQGNGKPASGSTNYNDRNNRLRGRKFYRHWGEWDTLPARQQREYRRADNERDKQNRTLFEVLAPGARFTFQVKFENLQPGELGALLWSLQLEDGMFHRLGFAKPLGFGSVKICVTEVAIQSMATRYDSLLYSNARADQLTKDEPQTPPTSVKDWICVFVAQMEEVYCKKGESFGNLTSIADLKALLSAPKAPLPIHYPRQGEDASADGENFKWFMGNKRRVQLEARNQLPAPQTLSFAIDDCVGFTLMDEKGNPL